MEPQKCGVRLTASSSTITPEATISSRDVAIRHNEGGGNCVRFPLVWDPLQADTTGMVESVTSGRAGGLGYVNRSPLTSITMEVDS
jgi:hypothetical protein